MKKRTSRLLSTLLVLCMVLALLPGTAWGDEVMSSHITIRYETNWADVEVWYPGLNEVTITIADQTTPLSGEGWSYEPASTTLILDGIEAEYIEFYQGNEPVGNYTLELRGVNTLSDELLFMTARGEATTTITGSGSLVADMYATGMDVVMKGGTITTRGERSYWCSSFGSVKAGMILNRSSFYMIDGTFNAIGGDYGIFSDGFKGSYLVQEQVYKVSKKPIVLEGGTVTAYGNYGAMWIVGGDKSVLGTDLLDFGGRTAVGGKEESDRQVLSVKSTEKERPDSTNSSYITTLASGELTPGAETEEGWPGQIGAAKYAYISGAGQTATPDPSDFKIQLSDQKLSVDGKSIDCEKYNIDGSNYFKLRDLASLLSGTGSQFEVGYDNASKTVSITTGAAYTPNGSELPEGGEKVDNSSTAEPSGQTILINGVKHDDLTVYNIGGSNFFMLRELGDLLGFDVDYDQSTDTAIVKSR